MSWPDEIPPIRDSADVAVEEVLSDIGAEKNGRRIEAPLVWTTPKSRDPALHPHREFVPYGKDKLRQAGSSDMNNASRFIADFKVNAEKSLYLFAYAVLGLTRLTTTLHKPVCQWLTQIPAYRKMLLLPRDHLKTSIASRSLPLHILIQPKESNIYRPNYEGASTRILLANETVSWAEKQLRWIKAKCEGGYLLRRLWPDVFWSKPTRQAPAWTKNEIVLQRSMDYPEPSIDTVGVGGAIAGRHYDVIIDDDLATLKAANSETLMLETIEWHTASRSLFDDPNTGLEFIIGTRWTASDLYQNIIDNDPSVEYQIRAIEEPDDESGEMRPIMPVGGEGKVLFTSEIIKQLRREYGTLFWLLYMNSADNPELTDFDVQQIRAMVYDGNTITFNENELDTALEQFHNVSPSAGMPDNLQGLPLNKATLKILIEQSGPGLRLVA